MASTSFEANNIKRVRKVNHAARRAKRRALKKLSRLDRSKIDKNNDKDAINKLPVTVFICDLTDPMLQSLDQIPTVPTSLEQVDTVTKLHHKLSFQPLVIVPLRNIYGLSLVNHEKSMIGFTDTHGIRHTMPLINYTQPDQASASDATIMNAWKTKIRAGQLEHNPLCQCCHAKHGIEVKELLNLNGTVERRVSYRANELGHLPRATSERNRLRRAEERSRTEDEGLRQRLRQMWEMSAEHDVSMFHSGETDGEDDDTLEDGNYDN